MLDRTRDLRRNSTAAERLLWAELRNRSLQGAKFRRQHRIGGYIADFVCLKARLIIELDGAHHHLPVIRAQDRTRTMVLEGADYRVLRFSNAEVFDHVEAVLNLIAGKLK